jgi:hypothetical protein
MYSETMFFGNRSWVHGFRGSEVQGSRFWVSEGLSLRTTGYGLWDRIKGIIADEHRADHFFRYYPGTNGISAHQQFWSFDYISAPDWVKES